MKVFDQVVLGGLTLFVLIGLVNHYGVIYKTFFGTDYSGYTKGELIGMIADCQQIRYPVAERIYGMDFCRRRR